MLISNKKSDCITHESACARIISIIFSRSIVFWHDYRVGVMCMKKEIINEESEDSLDDVEDIYLEDDYDIEKYALNVEVRRRIEYLLEKKRLDAEDQDFLGY